MKKILITGAFGLVGSDLVDLLAKKHGKENIIAISHKASSDVNAIVEHGDVRDKESIGKIIEKHNIETI